MKRIVEDVKKFRGNVLTICVEDNKIMSAIKGNRGIKNAFELNRDEPSGLFKRRKKKLKLKKGKRVKITKFRKLFKKEKVDYLIIDLNNVLDYHKYIASNAIYTCKKKIYIYGESDYLDAKMVSSKYRRYKTKIEEIQNKNKFIVIVDCSEAKYSRIKEMFYIFIDTFHNIGDWISLILTS